MLRHEACGDFNHEAVRSRQPEAFALHFFPSRFLIPTKRAWWIAKQSVRAGFALSFARAFGMFFESAAQFKHGGRCSSSCHRFGILRMETCTIYDGPVAAPN